MAKYPVKRGNRYDRLSINLVHDWTLAGIQELDGGGEYDDEKDDLTKRTHDFAIALIAGNELLAQYCRIVIYSGTNGNGQREKMKTTDGDAFTVPEKDAPHTELGLGYINWLKIDEEEQEEIDTRIIELNKPPAARHILPVGQLTEEEKTDPNSLSEGAKTKKG